MIENVRFFKTQIWFLLIAYYAVVFHDLVCF